MRRRLLIVALAAACLLAAPSLAQSQTRALWPGVLYETGVQFTSHGPVALNILRGPRPGGATTLQPVISNDTLLDRETLTSITKRLSSTATAAAGVNGDFFNRATGRPTGVVVRDGQLVAPPLGDRSSMGVLTDGTLQVRRASFFGTWRGSGQSRTLNTFNEAPKRDSIALFTDAYGAATPPIGGSVAAVFFPFPATVPNVDLEAVVLETRSGATAVPIPSGGAVLLARGTAASALRAEAPVGQLVWTRLILQPDWDGLVAAIGGGPEIVRDGAPIFRANEAFTSVQLGRRRARSAVAQLRDGSTLLVAVDGSQPGYSVGLTNFELAQTLVRLGAVTGMALDSGGSTTMAFDGTLLNKPSSGGERAISTALLFLYTGVYVAAAPATVTPNGDGVDDDPGLAVRISRPSTVTVTLTAPDGRVAFTETADRQPGSYPVAFSPAGTTEAGTASVQAPSSGSRVSGRWKLRAEATDDLGAATRMTQVFKVNATLVALSADPPKAFVPPGGREIHIAWRLARRARVVVTIVDRDGVVVRTLATRRYAAGERSVTWDGLGPKQAMLRGGMYRARVVARNVLGETELVLKIPLQNIAKRPS
jgi:hypothetical protein